ncbi:sirohydrochlorin cobaltochelatase [Clostridium sp. CMCC3677]|uniref:sirohydrochlorin cobaltochelatase n=1 Tax=Clostridium sp. CMCC3677 TaxID=2949963 RepID=UPI0013F0AB42|nr:sirohydrochlorin cobaltochelatase [Clostridium sp. CMCC3677]NFG61741.1 sirohydrochlorin cobaltochelatase [Clostridium botulinum]NFQ08526.1 sirohydrochlorin cobaltochelatase [Clostridium botulinum]
MKKAILVVSFGTSHLDALENSIERIENKIKYEFKDYEIFRAFTAHKIIKKLKNVHNIDIATPEEALEDLYKKGFKEVIIQPLHIIPGEEFDYIKGVAKMYKDKFSSLKLGRPIFYYQGIEDAPQDYTLFINSIETLLKKNECTILFGHGTPHCCNSVYGCLQSVLVDEGYDNVFVGTVEGYPTFETVLKRVKRKNINNVTLVPLMVVAGDHVKNDMASEEEDSWKSMFLNEGINAEAYIHGLGEIDEFTNLYISRIYDLIEDRYLNVGSTKKLHCALV